MNKDKKKEVFSRDELIQCATSHGIPSLFNTIENDGFIVKEYPFIRGCSNIYESEWPEINVPEENYTLLSLYKNEIEKQLELNRKHCVGYYNGIKAATSNWLNEKFNLIGFTQVYENGAYSRKVKLNVSTKDELLMFMFQIDTMIYWLMLGVELAVIKKDLQTDGYKPVIYVEKTTRSNDSVVFDIDELIEKIQPYIVKIERVVSRSVDLYFQYVNYHASIYNFDIDKFVDQVKTQHNESNLPADWDSIYDQMDELTSKGHSAKEASELVEKQINGIRAAGTIRNKYKGYL